MLTQEEIGRIKAIADKIRENFYRVSLQDKIIDDITYLKAEIMEELDASYPLFQEYLSLVDKEQIRLDPLRTYEAGKEAGLAGKDRENALMEYYRREAADSETQKLYADMQRCHDRLRQALGDKNGLVVEFLELYRFAYGGLLRSSDLFFTMGYAAGRKQQQ